MKIVLEITDIDIINELKNHTDKQDFIEETILYYIRSHQKYIKHKPIELSDEELDEIFGKEEEKPKKQNLSREEMDEMIDKMINDDNFWN